MANGVATNNVDTVPLSDAVLVNKDGSTAQQMVADLFIQAAGSGAISERLASVDAQASSLATRATDLEETASAHDTRLAAQEAREFVESPIYANTAAGLAATAVSDIFKVRTDDPATVAYYEYLHDTGDVAVLTTTVPATAVMVDKVSQAQFDATIEQDDAAEVDQAVVDDDGFASAYIAADGAYYGAPSGLRFALGAIDAGTIGIEQDDRHSLVLMIDDDGFASVDALDGPKLLPSASATTFSAAEIAAIDSAAYAASMQVRGRQSNVARPVWGISHHITTGQSLSNGQEAWPALTTSTALTTSLGIYMLGDSIRPDGKFTDGWAALGTDVLNPARCVTQSADFSAILTDVEVAALAAGDNVPGEMPDLAALITLQIEWLRQQMRASEVTKKIVLTSCGVGGKSISELSDGSSPDYYARVEDAVAAVKAQAIAAGVSYGVNSILHMQGESDQDGTDGTDFKSGTLAYFDALEATILAASGQSARPAIYTYQTKQTYASARVAQRQLEMAQERANVFLAAPSYPVTDKGTHLDSNGSRWLACQIGKVMSLVTLHGHDWHPLSPRAARVRGPEILVDFHTPEPPLQWRSFYNGSAATLLSNRGFKVYVNDSAVTISSVEIVGNCTVKITLGTPPLSGAQVRVAYADGSDGDATGGNLADSDPWVAPFSYEYLPDSGMYAVAEIAALVDKPYPLNNFCAAFCALIAEEA
ncbi:hypothetical protein AQS8620_01412 [Aquimixticola soesokkakensis]|uniref:Sialate O-acetylesterase domain-containing protein n=1 Tax=Aquimixticola soesokkakensis TaxID=1519096 RepID=A0A1Y5SEQ0_9RHOB|nr:sialate O-acetylesterase [Aquimixticola soesokkakensis]SLN37899.1 hypothetical protein AQS8620_01412 [Aquimixticola soesokkakensis]